MKTLVFFGAHPDDESFSVGSTLAQYASSGVKVYYVCSTGGQAGTVDQRYLREYDSIEKLRAAELKCAAEVLGLAGVFYLGYRDSGMPGSPDNKHPDSLAMAPLQVAVGRAVKIIREIKPDVVITHDTGGGYGHPDHIATHNITIKAFQAAGGQGIYPEAGPVFQPKKLYFAVYPRRLMKIAVRLMPLFGQDPHHFGRNKDVDLTEMMGIEHPVHAVISLQKRSIDLRKKAIACHASQSSGEGRPGPFNILGIVEKVMGSKAYYMRAFPPATRHREKDLFEGIT